MYDLHTKETRKRVTVEGDESDAKVSVADINFGCPAIVHVIDAVLLPTLEDEEEEENGSVLAKLFSARH